jgi:hypothetical protein
MNEQSLELLLERSLRKVLNRKRYLRRYRNRGKRRMLLGFNHWLASKPRCIRRLAHDFPIGTRIVIETKVHYLMGYSESAMLILSPVNPAKDYDAAQHNLKYVCASHIVNVT